MKRLCILVVFLSSFVFSTALSQFEPGKSYGGVSLGYSFLGSVPSYGLNYEYGVKTDFGLLGIGGIFRYWSYSENYGSWGKWSYSDIAIGAQGNYHFKLDNKKIDPFVGVVLAYDAGSVDFESNVPGYSYSWSEPTHGGIYFEGQAGCRYFIKENIAISARIGAGSSSYGAFEIGLDIKF